MKIIVLGAGVIGVTTAWYLAKQGHEVTVLEQASSAAMNTSFANAGQLSYGYAMPWAAPGVPMKALKWMFDENAPFKLHWDKDDAFAQASWLLKMLKNCNMSSFERNKGRMLALSHYSKAALSELQAELPDLRFDHQSKGTLQVFRHTQQLDAAQRDARMLEDAGVACELISRPSRIYELEPALEHSQVPVVAALWLPGDETGDCHKFTQQLAAKAQEKGVEFHYETRFVKWIEPYVGGIKGVLTDKGAFDADAFVVALGCDTPQVLSKLGLKADIYPVKGYSLTYAVSDSALAPSSTVMDETYKVAITRLGDRVRVGGTAELAGFSRTLRQARKNTLQTSVTGLFPKAGQARDAQFWTGLRPSTPDGVPYIGKAFHKGLWINAGHGTLGWTMAAGSAKVLSKAIAGELLEHEDALLKAIG